MPSSACKTCARSEEHTSELQSHDNLVCRLLLEKKIRIRVVAPRPARLPDPLVGLTQDRVRAHACPVRRPALFPTGGPTGLFRFSLFFLNEGAPPELPPLPHRVALPL